MQSRKQSPPQMPMSPSRVRAIGVPLVTLAIVIAIWELACDSGLVPAYLLPSPHAVVLALVKDAALIASHVGVTIEETFLGLLAGMTLGGLAAILMNRFETVRLALNPLLTVSQTIPTVAIAPLLVLWLGYGVLPKVVLVTLTTFFPIAVALLAGLDSVSADELNLMRTLKASRAQVFWHLKLPTALPSLFSGIEMSVTYAVVTAVVAEWLGGDAGLGVYMTRVRKSFAYDRMFAVILVIIALSLVLMRVVHRLGIVCMPWQHITEHASEESR